MLREFNCFVKTRESLQRKFIFISIVFSVVFGTIASPIFFQIIFLIPCHLYFYHSGRDGGRGGRGGGRGGRDGGRGYVYFLFLEFVLFLCFALGYPFIMMQLGTNWCYGISIQLETVCSR